MDIFSLDNLFTLAMLTLLQAVLGFDNLLYISLESQRAPADKQALVRRIGIALAMILRIGLLFLLVSVIDLFKAPWFAIQLPGIVEGTFNVHSIIVLLGGAFIIYTATKEIWHMMQIQQLGHGDRNPKSVATLIFWIVLMNLVFSFDSILSAIALTDVFWVMATAIFIGAVLMIWLADGVAAFLEKNRMYEVLGLFILLVVGIMLLSEGGHLAHLYLFDTPITPMTKATFYFVIVVLVLTDIVQSRYRKKLMAQRALAEGNLG
ncbi:MAG: tellurium resistance protein TerC [Gammaproteobacteria bacterium]|nr:tellurium resistance protein TerC [Gammaproteobacteria bacterium]NNC57185.1 tellurium resistance protein TerC [Woeseiaceae bacterium]NNL50860.1 tellurium resistance protein TerC [Woeseiaceae bacterium]